jgi:hypothetical protein
MIEICIAEFVLAVDVVSQFEAVEPNEDMYKTDTAAIAMTMTKITITRILDNPLSGFILLLKFRMEEPVHCLDFRHCSTK